MSAAQALERARAAQQVGDIRGAVAAYRAAIAEGGETWDAAYQLGLLHQELGEIPQAAEAYSRAIAISPARYEPYLNLGVCHFTRGASAEAIAALTAAAVRSGPDMTPHINLGRIHLGEGRLQEARHWLERAAAGGPDVAQAHFYLAITLRSLSESVKAETAFKTARDLAPQDPHIRYDYARMLDANGKPAEARAEILEADRLAPGTPAVLRFQLFLAKAAGDKTGVSAAVAKLLALGPLDADIAIDILDLIVEEDQKAPARTALQHFVRTTPNNPAAWNQLARDAHARADYEECMEILDDGIKATGDAALRLTAALTLPKVPLSNAQIAFARGEMDRHLSALIAERPRIVNPFKSVGRTAFTLAYHGRNEREMQTRIAEAHLAVSPELAWTAPHCANSGARLRSGRKIRIGFFSVFFRDHSVGRLIAKLILSLDRNRFEVCVIGPPGDADEFGQRIIRSADTALSISLSLEKAREEIAALELDILFYTDIGMEVLTYYLALAKLAPVQVVWPGHPLTTGIPAIDVFISTSVFEPKNAQAHYSERLFLLDGLPGSEESRGWTIPKTLPDIDVPDGPLYVCPMSLFKFHPDMDELFEMIAQRDPKGRFIIIGKSSSWERKRNQRIRDAAPAAASRLTVLPWLSYEKYLALLARVDVVLDTIHFAGGNTTRDAFAVSTPVAALAGDYLRDRTTAGMYRLMGLGHHVSPTHDAYADFAVRAANDAAVRRKISDEIAGARPRLFDEDKVLPQYQDLFMNLVRGH